MAKTNPLIFKDAEKARDAITNAQKKKIAKLYEQWADEIGKTADKFGSKKNPSAVVSEAQMRELKKQLLATRDQTIKEVENSIKSSLVQVADAVVSSNVKWLEGFGFPKTGLNAAFTNVPKNIVEKLVTGNLYEGGWSLSKAIWGDSEKTMAEAYRVVAGGLAKNQSVYEIAKDLQKYISPSAKKDWNLTDKDGKKIYPKNVDYAAQRLVRTLAQHSYQQAFKETTEKNPFITKYRWNANGSRACEVCKKRDGKLFDKDKLPLDHPNGMCVMEPVTKSDEEITDELAAWVNGEDGDYPEIDKFAQQFGYKLNVKDKVAQKASKVSKAVAGKTTKAAATKASEATTKAELTLSQIKEKYGDSKYKTLNTWLQKLPEDVQNTVKKLKKESGLKWDDFYEKNFKAGSSVVKFNDLQNKFLKDFGFDESNMPKDFSDWSWTVSKNSNKMKDLMKSAGIDYYSKHPYQEMQKYFEENVMKGFSYGSGKAENAAFNAAKKTAKKLDTIASSKSNSSEFSEWIETFRKQSIDYFAKKEHRLDKLPKGVVKTLEEYTGSSYKRYNRYLRELGKGLSKKDAIEISGISETQANKIDTAVNKFAASKTEEEIFVRRGTDVGELAGIMEGDFLENKEKLSRLTAEELNDMFAGTTFKYSSFTSTSSDYGLGFDGEVEVIMNLKKGTMGSSVTSISQYGKIEGEFLINAGQMMRIDKIEKSDGHRGSSIRIFMTSIV